MVDKFGWCCHLWIAISLDIAAISTVVAPWSPGTEVLWVCCTVGGAVETIINIGLYSDVFCMHWRLLEIEIVLPCTFIYFNYLCKFNFSLFLREHALILMCHWITMFYSSSQNGLVL